MCEGDELMIARSGARTLATGALLLAIAILASPLIGAQNFDLVIANGRVLDPESRLDAVRNVGISGRKITAISRERLSGTTTIDAAGLIVAPGFIDLHAHSQIAGNLPLSALTA